MLYDPKWEIKKPEAFTLADFIAWLETKDPSEKYDFDDCYGECLMGQYMTAHGRAFKKLASGDGTTYWQSCGQVFGDPQNASVLVSHPRTFGAALERAREFASQ